MGIDLPARRLVGTVRMMNYDQVLLYGIRYGSALFLRGLV
jgi:hypothetical protein